MSNILLTVFILPSYRVNGNVDKTLDSIATRMPVKVVLVDDVEDVNKIEKTTAWFGIFYDDECIDLELRRALISYLSLESADCLFLYEDCCDRAAPTLRLFRSHIEIKQIDGEFEPCDRDVCQLSNVLVGLIQRHDFPRNF